MICRHQGRNVKRLSPTTVYIPSILPRGAGLPPSQCLVDKCRSVRRASLRGGRSLGSDWGIDLVALSLFLRRDSRSLYVRNYNAWSSATLPRFGTLEDLLYGVAPARNEPSTSRSGRACALLLVHSNWQSGLRAVKTCKRSQAVENVINDKRLDREVYCLPCSGCCVVSTYLPRYLRTEIQWHDSRITQGHKHHRDDKARHCRYLTVH
ncbi:hypothetical protein BJ170DRAFT_328884 [Xylariales sp. AK1849]|nr:hypothetical protein BJ170DRAFT_328884 [Xylariales sp. AK1849]